MERRKSSVRVSVSGGVPARPEPWPALIESRDRIALLREVGRAMAAGELAGAGNLRRKADGRWAVDVLRLADPPRPRPVWVKPVLIGSGVVAAFAGLAALGWWLVSVVTAALAGLSVAGLLGAGTLGVLLWAGARRSGCDVTVIVRHRH